MTLEQHDHDALTYVDGRVGRMRLNRPKAIHALNLNMVHAMTNALISWRDDPRVELILIDHAEGRGFCAGGDVVSIAKSAGGHGAAGDAFFYQEYRMNHLMYTYTKPGIVFMDGITMGGGVGITCPAKYRIATERTVFSMPETGIGLFPDVGGGYFLSRCPGHAGEWLALTGEHVKGGDGLAIGWGDHFLSSARQADVWQALGEQDFVDGQAVRDWLRLQVESAPPESDGFAQARRLADGYFGGEGVSDILHALEAAADDAWALGTAQALRKRSPLMLHVVLDQVRRARHLSLADDLRMERTLVRHCFFPAHLGRTATSSEVVEGVRALVVDKDNAPRWNPPAVEEVTPEMVAGFFVAPWPRDMHPLAHLR